MSLILPIQYNCEINCTNCSAKDEYNIEIEDLEFETSYERNMGSENEYSFISEIKCSKCKSVIEVVGEVWEYPEGTVNLIELK